MFLRDRRKQENPDEIHLIMQCACQNDSRIYIADYRERYLCLCKLNEISSCQIDTSVWFYTERSPRSICEGPVIWSVYSDYRSSTQDHFITEAEGNLIAFEDSFQKIMRNKTNMYFH